MAWRILALSLLVAAASAAVAGAQGSKPEPEAPAPEVPPRDPDPDQRSNDELVRRLEEGGDTGDEAAYQLFARKQFKLLEGVMGREGNAKLCILRALKLCGGDAPRPACELVLLALRDPRPEVTKLAIATGAMLEHDEAFAFIHDTILELGWGKPGTRDARQAEHLLGVLERMRYVPRVVRELARLYSKRYLLDSELEQKVSDTLVRLTGLPQRSPQQWLEWSAEIQSLTLAEWRLQVEERRAAQTRALADKAENLFRRLLASLDGEPERFVDELVRELGDETVPAVTRLAIDELGKIGGQEGHSQRERAVTALRDRLTQRTAASDETLGARLLLALGETRDPGLLEDVREFLNHSAPRLQAAAADALGRMRAPGASQPLRDQLNSESKPPPLVVRAVVRALGEIGENSFPEEGSSEDPTLKLSDRLVQLCTAARAVETPGPDERELQETVVVALGKLPYSGGEDVSRVLALLSKLLSDPAENLRNKVVTTLGRLANPIWPEPGQAFELLESRLGVETEQHIRRQILDAIGAQALADPRLYPRAVDVLVPFLFSADADAAPLTRTARERLRETARGEDLADLERLVQAILRDRDERVGLQAAQPFLAGLPQPVAVPEAAKKRYAQLLGMRARARVLVGDAPGALDDLDVALPALGFHAADEVSRESLPLFIAQGRARLLQKDPAGSFSSLLGCLQFLARQEADPGSPGDGGEDAPEEPGGTNGTNGTNGEPDEGEPAGPDEPPGDGPAPGDTQPEPPPLEPAERAQLLAEVWQLILDGLELVKTGQSSEPPTFAGIDLAKSLAQLQPLVASAPPAARARYDALGGGS